MDYTLKSNLIESSGERSNYFDLDALGIQLHNLELLDTPISEMEVWNTIKDLSSDKAPGPDGFTGRLYKQCFKGVS